MRSFEIIRTRSWGGDPDQDHSWYIKGLDESTRGKDLSVLLMPHNLTYLGSLTLIRIFPKERTLSNYCFTTKINGCNNITDVFNFQLQSLKLNCQRKTNQREQKKYKKTKKTIPCVTRYGTSASLTFCICCSFVCFKIVRLLCARSGLAKSSPFGPPRSHGHFRS